MIDAYYWPTPNGWKLSIMLEECGLPYRLRPVNIARGEQFSPDFVAISPNNRVPAIVDHAPVSGCEPSGCEPSGCEPSGCEPLTLFESGAILQYLAEKSGQLMPTDTRARYETLAWVNWQVANLGPIAGQVAHFCNYAKERVPYAVQRFTNEFGRLLAVLDRRLRGREFVAANAYSIADIASFSWVRGHRQLGVNIDEYPELRRWHDHIAARPAVARGVAVGVDWQHGALDDEARRHLFTQSAATIRQMA